jgi:hypothetical protein
MVRELPKAKREARFVAFCFCDLQLSEFDVAIVQGLAFILTSDSMIIFVDLLLLKMGNHLEVVRFQKKKVFSH